MPLTLNDLSLLRPFVFHVCGIVNFTSIQASRSLKSVAQLLEGTPQEHLLHGRRSASSVVWVEGRRIEVRDHRPLALGSLKLPDGYSVQDFINELNSRVFFWVGTEAGPVPSGRRHIGRYSSEGEVRVLRIPLPGLLEHNSARTAEVTFCNSGSARHNGGLPAYRSPATFQRPKEAERSAAAVVELTYRTEANLPSATLYASNLAGPWAAL